MRPLRHRPPRPPRLIAGLLVVLLLLSGCSTTLEDLPLPGTGVPGETISVTADFADALNLASGATVKVNGVDSGRVQEVTTKDFTAQVTMTLRADAEVREGATARLRYTTPLGELFVEVTNPTSGTALADGANLELTRTSTAPTVEDALSQASLLINGGGLAQLQVVTDELNDALGGREQRVRSLVDESTEFVTQANATTADIDAALRALDSVARTLRGRQTVINRALREVRPAAKVLRQNTPGLTRLLDELERFSGQANTTVTRTRSQVLGLLRLVEPVLAEMQRNSRSYPLSLTKLTALGRTVQGFIPNDYAAIRLVGDLGALRPEDLVSLLDSLGLPIKIGDLLDLLGLGGLLGRTDAGGLGISGIGPLSGVRSQDGLGLSGLTDGLTGGLTGGLGGGGGR